MKFIVYWVVIQFVSTPCDWSRPNKFGLSYTSTTGISCAAIHGKYEVKDRMSKEFNDRDSAMAFYKEAYELKKQPIFMSFGDRIDSLRFVER